MLLSAQQQCLHHAAAGRRAALPVCRYRGSAERGEHRDEQHQVFTSTDPVHGGLSPESHAILLALLEKGLPFKEVKVDMSKKPQEFQELFHSIIPDIGVPSQVPVLVHGSKRLADSSTIVDYLAAQYPDSGTALLPPDAYAAARVKLFIAYFKDHVVPAYTHLIHAEGAAVAGAKEALMKALAAVDAFLALHGAGEGEVALGPHWGFTMSATEDQAPSAPGGHEHYLMGPFYTTAEVLCTPYVARMVETLPEWRGVDVLAECDARALSRVAGWMRACLARPSAAKTAPSSKELLNGLVEWEMSHAV